MFFTTLQVSSNDQLSYQKFTRPNLILSIRLCNCVISTTSVYSHAPIIWYCHSNGALHTRCHRYRRKLPRLCYHKEKSRYEVRRDNRITLPFWDANTSLYILGEQGWRSGGSAGLPQMWPGFVPVREGWVFRFPTFPNSIRTRTNTS